MGGAAGQHTTECVPGVSVVPPAQAPGKGCGGGVCAEHSGAAGGDCGHHSQLVSLLCLLYQHPVGRRLYHTEFPDADGGNPFGGGGGAVYLLAPQCLSAGAVLPVRPSRVFPGADLPPGTAKRQGGSGGFLPVPAELHFVVCGVPAHLWGDGPVCDPLLLPGRDGVPPGGCQGKTGWTTDSRGKQR